MSSAFPSERQTRPGTRTLSLQLGDIAPDFTAETTEGTIRFHDWKGGDDVIIVPSLSNEDAKAKFPHGWKELKPYLRVVPQPRD